MEKSKDQVLAWAAYGPSIEKIGFIKSFLNCLSTEELKHIKNITTKTASKKATKARQWIGPRQTVAPTNQQNSTVSTPDLSVSGPVEIAPKSPWWRMYKKDKVVSIDVEKVALLALQGVNRSKAATVCICDHEKVLYRATVYHKPGTFLVNPATIKVNGFRRNSLVNGKELEEVSSEVATILVDKLVITVAGENDFRSLNLRPNEFDYFDLQEHYKRSHPERVFDTTPMSLRDMYFMHFNRDMQRGSHSAEIDAIATMRIFMEGYIKIKTSNVDARNDDITFDSALKLKEKEKRHEIFCNREQTFNKYFCKCTECN